MKKFGKIFLSMFVVLSFRLFLCIGCNNAAIGKFDAQTEEFAALDSVIKSNK